MANGQCMLGLWSPCMLYCWVTEAPVCETRELWTSRLLVQCPNLYITMSCCYWVNNMWHSGVDGCHCFVVSHKLATCLLVTMLILRQALHYKSVRCTTQMTSCQKNRCLSVDSTVDYLLCAVNFTCDSAVSVLQWRDKLSSNSCCIRIFLFSI